MKNGKKVVNEYKKELDDLLDNNREKEQNANNQINFEKIKKIE